jgi:hypothetical protein
MPPESSQYITYIVCTKFDSSIASNIKEVVPLVGSPF